MNAAVGFLILCIVLLGAVTCRAEEAGSAGGTVAGRRPAGTTLAQVTPRYYDEQLLHYRYSEFCASVKWPPQKFVEMIEQAAQAGNKDALEAFAWIAPLMMQYKKNGCGDA
jgi:hypothetical protein